MAYDPADDPRQKALVARYNALMAEQADAERDRLFRRAPGPILYLERLAVARGMHETAARIMVGDVIAEYAHAPDIEATWVAIYTEVVRRSDIPRLLRTTE